MSRTKWEDRYATGDLPWDTGEPDHHLVRMVEERPIRAGAALEIGCGTGTNALWLAQHGFNVMGVDLSSVAIEQARAKLSERELPCRFATADILSDDLPAGPFDFVFDRGCFHVFDEATDRATVAQRVAQRLADDGVWLSLIGSTEGPPRDHGPPRRSLRDIALAVEPHLAIDELRLVEFRANIPSPASAWLCVARKRVVPAQPSTRRD